MGLYLCLSALMFIEYFKSMSSLMNSYLCSLKSMFGLIYLMIALCIFDLFVLTYSLSNRFFNLLWNYRMYEK
jgi:hypothetical protein